MKFGMVACCCWFLSSFLTFFSSALLSTFAAKCQHNVYTYMYTGSLNACDICSAITDAFAHHRFVVFFPPHFSPRFLARHMHPLFPNSTRATSWQSHPKLPVAPSIWPRGQHPCGTGCLLVPRLGFVIVFQRRLHGVDGDLRCQRLLRRLPRRPVTSHCNLAGVRSSVWHAA